MPSQLQCAGCDLILPVDSFATFSCPNQGGDDTDHVLRLQLDAKTFASRFPTEPFTASQNPWLRYRRLSHSYQLATRLGMKDSQYVDLCEQLSTAIARADGKEALRVTSYSWSEALHCDVKNETENVSGSHKARHLIATALHLKLAARLDKSATASPTLAIASCGNAALAAAVVAHALEWPLQVFVPPSAPASVVNRLHELGAEQVVCERSPGAPPGDPCYHAFRQAIAQGALPFSCQGGDNAIALLGGHTLGWELIEQSRRAPLDHLFIQVGGGALASSVMQAFAMAKDAGVISTLPRFHAVQTDNAHPLARAWSKLEDSGTDLSEARHKRSKYMWAWESEPKSVASGILDDETYDWFSIATLLRVSKGSVVTVSEERLTQAQQLGQAHTGISVDATGTAGLAGLLEARERGDVSTDQRSAVLFTGALR